MIEVNNIVKRFGDLEVLHGVSLEVKRGEIVSIVGASGAGKTTLLQIIGSLLRADSGEVIINGIALSTLTEDALSVFRNRHIGFIFQSYHLLPEFTALENVMMPMLIAGGRRSDAELRARELLGVCCIVCSMEADTVSELSDLAGTAVACHDEHCVFEVNGVSVSVGEPSFVHYL